MSHLSSVLIEKGEDFFFFCPIDIARFDTGTCTAWEILYEVRINPFSLCPMGGI